MLTLALQLSQLFMFQTLIHTLKFDTMELDYLWNEPDERFKILTSYSFKVTADLQGSNFAKIIFFAYSKAEKGIYNLVKN